jgi:hypothetical protein
VAGHVHTALVRAAARLGVLAADRLLAPDAVAALSVRARADALVPFRIYAAVTAMAAASPAVAARLLHLPPSPGTDVLLPNAEALATADPLAKLSALDAMEALVAVPGGAAFAAAAGVVVPLHALLRQAVAAARAPDARLEPLDSLVLTRAIVAYGAVRTNSPPRAVSREQDGMKGILTPTTCTDVSVRVCLCVCGCGLRCRCRPRRWLHGTTTCTCSVCSARHAALAAPPYAQSLSALGPQVLEADVDANAVGLQEAVVTAVGRVGATVPGLVLLAGGPKAAPAVDVVRSPLPGTPPTHRERERERDSERMTMCT